MEKLIISIPEIQNITYKFFYDTMNLGMNKDNKNLI